MTREDELIFSSSVDNAEIVFESGKNFEDRFTLTTITKWDRKHVAVSEVADLPVVGADIEYGEHATTVVAQEELSQESDSGYDFELLQQKGKLETFYRYPVFLSVHGDENQKNGIVLWMTALDLAQLLPKIPLKIMSSVLEDLKRRYVELATQIGALHEKTDISRNGDILNSGVSTENFNPNFQVEAYETYTERLELSRLAYGVWLRAIEFGDLKETDLVADQLLECFSIEDPFFQAKTIGDLISTIRNIAAETEISRFFSDLDMSGLFGADLVSKPASMFVKEIYGYELSEFARKGIFAELLALKLSNALFRIVNEVKRDGDNALDLRSANWVKSLIFFLTNGMLVSIPVERASKILKPIWDVLEQKLAEFGMDSEFDKIKKELGTYHPLLAEALTGEIFS